MPLLDVKNLSVQFRTDGGLQLLLGEPVRDIIKENRLMPSMVADAINEALFDEIGDTVLSCEDDVLSLVGDYRDDIEQLLGENRT